MKKSFIFFVLAMLLTFTAGMAMPQETSAKKNLTAGSVIKGKGLSTLYYLGEDGKRYVFPNDKTYFSWFDDFSSVEEIELTDLYDYPLGGNAQYKPGKFLVKITTDPKVYAVGSNGILHWVKTEKLAKHFYGDNWNKMIDDVPDSFFTNYSIGDPVESEDGYNPDEEEQEVPTISHNIGLKAKIKIQNKIQNMHEKRCRYLSNTLNRLQKRAAQWGFNLPSIGDDYLSECASENNDDSNTTDPNNTNKIIICHKGTETLSIAKAALKAHIKHGDSLGACSEDDTPVETDETAPVISAISASTGATSATITWTTDESADSVIEYATESIASTDTTTEKEDSTKVTSHSVQLTGLTAETTYYYVVKSTDASGNTTVSDERTFTTGSESDVTAPVISAINATPGATSATITWTTDETADSVVEYATESIASTDTTTEKQDTTKVTSHSIQLTGLTAETTYYYVVKSTDASGNTTTSNEGTFTTIAEADTTAPVISDITATPGADTATITWTTDESTKFKFSYASESLSTATSIIEVENTTMGTSHTVTLNGLSTSTEYFFKIEAKDEAENTSTSDEDSFTTTE